MTKNTSCLCLAALLAFGVPAVPAQAQLARTFVSAASGNDANDCNRATPCRTFQRAHDNTFGQGEITVLDPGGYGAVTITKSISIVNDGVGEAGLLVSGGATGIVINAPTAYVNLRGLTIQGIGFGGGNGIRLDQGYSLAISRCVIRNLTGTAIDLRPPADARLAISDTLVADNLLGILVGPSVSGVVKVDLDRVHVRNNSGDGFTISGGTPTSPVAATIADSVFAANSPNIAVGSALGVSPITVMVVRSVVSNSHGTALVALGAAARLMVGQSAISGNAQTFFVSNATLASFGDNYIAGNGDGDPGFPTIPKK